MSKFNVKHTRDLAAKGDRNAQIAMFVHDALMVAGRIGIAASLTDMAYQVSQMGKYNSQPACFASDSCLQSTLGNGQRVMVPGRILK